MDKIDKIDKIKPPIKAALFFHPNAMAAAEPASSRSANF
jgi:hypothetical protein